MAFMHPLGTIPAGAPIFQNHAGQFLIAVKLHATTRMCIMRLTESSANEILRSNAHALPRPNGLATIPKESNESCRAWQRHSSGRTFGHLGESLAVFGQINVVKLVVVVVLSIITGIVVCVVVVALPVRECRFN